MLDGNIWQKQTNLGPDPAKPWLLGEALPGCRMLPCCTVDLTDLGPSFGSQRCQKSRVAISESVLPEPYLSTARGQDTHALVHTSPYPISPQLPLYFWAFFTGTTTVTPALPDWAESTKLHHSQRRSGSIWA